MAWTTPKTDFVSGNILTAAQMNAIGNNLLALYGPVQRLGFQTRTTTSTSSVTSFASAADVFTSGITFTADGTSAYLVEFFASSADTSANTRDLFLALSVGGTETGRVNVYGDDRTISTMLVRRWLTPAAGSRTVNFRHYHLGGATALRAGDGTGANEWPMYMAVYGPALA